MASRRLWGGTIYLSYLFLGTHKTSYKYFIAPDYKVVPSGFSKYSCFIFWIFVLLLIQLIYLVLSIQHFPNRKWLGLCLMKTCVVCAQKHWFKTNKQINKNRKNAFQISMTWFYLIKDQSLTNQMLLICLVDQKKIIAILLSTS